MGAKVPSIKGSAFQSVLEDVRQLRAQGRIEPDELARSLTDKDRELLDRVVTSITWVPIESYAHMLELLSRAQGDDDPIAYLCARGARAAERLLSGSYRSFATEPGSWGKRVGETMVGMGRLLYNFTTWSFHTQADGVFEVRVSGARDYPDAARYTAQGFLQWFAEHAADRPMRVESTRPTPDDIAFRIESA
jgi:hypothetical protein